MYCITSRILVNSVIPYIFAEIQSVDCSLAARGYRKLVHTTTVSNVILYVFAKIANSFLVV